MEHLKVTITFSTPVAINSEYPTHMDGIIAALVCHEAESLGSDTPWEDADDLSVYLDKTNGDNWVWKASQLILTPDTGINFNNQIRKADPDKYFADLGKFWSGRNPTIEMPTGNIKPETFRIDTRSGQQRGYQWLNASQWIAKAEAWVVGDKDALESLLSSLTHVGMKKSNDWGRVKDIKIESCPENDKWKIRFMPLEENGADGVDYAIFDRRLHSPYSKKSGRVLVKEPIV